MFATDRTSSNEKIALFSGNFIACWISKATMPTNGTRLTVSLTLFLTSVTTSCIAQVGPAQDSPASATASRLAYTEKTNKTYSFPFGKANVSLPGNASVEGGGFLDPSMFPSAAYCGHCHQQAYREWRESLHSNSFRTPFYTKSVEILIRTKGVAYARYCDSCHNPIAVLSGAMNPKSTVDRSFDSDGLTCMTCHSIQSVEPKLGNGSYVMGAPSEMVDEQGNRIPGIVPDAEILAHLDRHAKAVMQDFYRQPEFCSACHKASLPPELNGYKWLRSFTPYDEWQDSMFSHQNPLTFYQADYACCQDCHMKQEVIRTRGQTGRSPTSYRREEPIKTSPLIFYVNSPPTDKMIPTEPNPFLI